MDPTISLPPDAPVDYSTGENIGASTSSIGTTFAPPEDSGASYRPVSGDFAATPFIVATVTACILWVLVKGALSKPAAKDPP